MDGDGASAPDGRPLPAGQGQRLCSVRHHGARRRCLQRVGLRGSHRRCGGSAVPVGRVPLCAGVPVPEPGVLYGAAVYRRQRVHHPTALSGECDPAEEGRGVHREHAAGRLSQHH